MKYQEISGKVKYEDVTEYYFDKDYKHTMLKCIYGDIWIGSIAWDLTQEIYMYFPAPKIQLSYEVLMNLSEKIYVLMTERQLN